jgi:hypothetical protein
VWSFQTASASALQLISVLPGSAAVNDGPVSVLAVGRNFAPGATLRWTAPGGAVTSLPTDFISSAQLQATLPPSLFTTSGTAQVAIQNPDTTLAGAQAFAITPAGRIYGVSLTPRWGSGPSQLFQLRVSDAAGVADIARIWIHATPSAGPFGGAPVNSCLLNYTFAGNRVGLLDDTGTATNSLTPGSAGTLQNSQCSIDMSAVSVSATGNDLLFSFPLQFQPGFTGLMQMAAAVDGTANSSPFQVVGNWMPVPPAFVRRYTFTFVPAENIGLAATWSYTSIGATPPGSAGLPVVVNPLAWPIPSGVRNADGSWSFYLNDTIDPIVSAFVAKTDLSFANSPGIYPAVPAQLSYCAGCTGVSNSGTGSGTVDITIADVATPQLSSLQPNTAMVDSGPTGMTVNGSNFASGAAVQWTFGGTTSTLPADFLTAVQLQTTVPASFLTTAGTAQVAATNPAGAPSGLLPFTVYYPQPILNSLNPNSAPAQSGPTQVTANGNGFFTGAKMLWTTPGGAQLPLPATFINSLQLQATIPASFLSTPGTAQVAIQNPGNLLSPPRQFLIGAVPLLAIAKTHAGNFTQGQTNAAYTVIVSSQGTGPTSGTVTVTDFAPPGMTLLSMAGSGWTCPGTAATNCTRSDTLAAGASYPPITVTVNVAANASSPQVNSVTVSGGGSATTTTTDSTVITTPTPQQALRFVPITPCRITDTRTAAGPFGGPPVTGGTSRDFTVPNSACGVPSTAQAYALNVAVVPSGTLGYLTLWPAGQTRPLASTLNSLDGRIKSNAAIVPAGTGGAVSVFASDTTQVILDINGYFVPATDPTGLAFYPITPCRIADTRNAAGQLGGPSLSGGQIRTFPILSSTCNLPATAQAYSLNFAAVPGGHPLGYVTAWPTGQAKPVVSSLNAPTGTVAANAAIVKAGTSGSIDVFASDTTNLVIDINGYFAPMATGGLSLYGVTPCRVVDTRKPAGSPAITSLDVGVSASACGIPANAQAHVLSVTAVPPGSLGYLTLWPQGQARPGVSTLNALDASVTSNLAIVPTGNGSISAFASDLTHLILDISGYFGQ